RFLQGEEERWLHEVDAERHPRDALGSQKMAKLRGGLLEGPRLGRHRAAHADDTRQRLPRRNLRRVATVVTRGRAEVPHPRLAVAGEQAPARELVARPFADDRAREIADVVLVEHEERAETRARQRLARAPEPIRVQTT